MSARLEKPTLAHRCGLAQDVAHILYADNHYAHVLMPTKACREIWRWPIWSENQDWFI